MSRSLRGMASALSAFWRGLRQWCGDADYERYVRAVRRRAATTAVSREQFYLEQLNRRSGEGPPD
jgi:uncharacterized short protein YbdD (DUF466 family)